MSREKNYRIFLSLLDLWPVNQWIPIDSGKGINLQFSHKIDFNHCVFQAYCVIFCTFIEVILGRPTRYDNREKEAAVVGFSAV